MMAFFVCVSIISVYMLCYFVLHVPMGASRVLVCVSCSHRVCKNSLLSLSLNFSCLLISREFLSSCVRICFVRKRENTINGSNYETR